ncbi:MAG: cobalamin-dependent protein, partial [Cyanobacteria bacterium HKST-UBA02]|nr:cobalamin-dependent protein [Cyanobacteria bacterium HKST-UBA02]
GKMQLPFVLQSAETMKAAVAYLEPLMEKVEGASRGTMVLATVKGDVHDIGKNLVDIILTNNGYKVINLGIKQPIENIIAASLENNATCIGMSGLLVKSTVIMKDNLDVLNQRGIHLPVILGGAALTRRYVENDCRKIYEGLLFYGQDAFDDLRIMESLARLRDGGRSLTDLSEAEVLGIEEAAATEPASVSSAVSDPVSSPVPADDTGSNGDESNGSVSSRSDVRRGVDVPSPPFWGSKVVEDIDLAEALEYLNMNVLIRGQWRVRQGDMDEAEYRRLLEDKIYPVFEKLKRDCIENRLLIPRAVYGYFPCYSSGNDLIVLDPDSRAEKVRFAFPRQDHGRRLCISDFFADRDEGEGEPDMLALQIVTVGEQATEHSTGLFDADKYSDYLFFHGLAVESAEATAELLHKRIRKELGVDGEDAGDINKLFQQGYRGTRYSFGYPACPNLEDQKNLFELLSPERIGVTLTEEFQLVPEQSTSAIIVHHPEAKYFNSRRNTAADTAESKT